MSAPGSYLLAISIGPVQDFIAASRKARDLWFGSALLSDVAAAAAKALRQAGADLIFPPNKVVDDLIADPLLSKPIANKLLAIIAGDKPADYATLAQNAAVKIIRDRWKALWTVLETDLRQRKAPAETIDSALALLQIKSFLEFAAAWAPYDPAAGDYAARRQEVERLLAGRKALRDFRPADGRAGYPKSSLDASRESVIRLDRVAPAHRERVRRRLRLKGAEQLDGVSLVKRLGEERRFVSVSRVAIDPFIRRVAHEPGYGQTALQPLRDRANALARAETDLAERFATDGNGLHQFADFPFDCQLFYDTKSSFDRRGLDDEEIEHAEKFIDAVSQLRGPGALGIGELVPYVAVLVADGDRMGAALNTLTRPSDHQTFSVHLTGFASEADKIVAEHCGAMVYSGGDDVLAFLPLDTALPCADALRRAFAQVMENALSDREVTKRPALSVGIAIGHFSEHLQSLLAWGRAAERAAKGPRNALAVALHTRTAGDTGRTVVHSWNNHPLQDSWWKAISLHLNDDLPDSAVYDLDLLRRELRAPGSALPQAEVTRLLQVEPERILKRKRAQHGEQAVALEDIEALTHRIGGDLAKLDTLVDELLIARRLARAIEIGADTAMERWRKVPGLADVKLRRSIAAPASSEEAVACIRT